MAHQKEPPPDERERQDRAQALSERLTEWLLSQPCQPMPAKVVLIALAKTAASVLQMFPNENERDEVAKRFADGVRELARFKPPKPS
jgi:hypothetical protein